MKKGRFTALLILLSLALAGCGGAEKGGSDLSPGASKTPGTQIAFENVFAETPMTVALDSIDYNGVVSAGERVYFSGYTQYNRETMDDGTDVRSALFKVVSCDFNGENVKTHWESEFRNDSAAKVRDLTQLSAFDADAAGNVWLLLNSTHMDETDARSPVYEDKKSLVKLAPDGAEIYNVDLSAAGNGELDGIYVQAMTHDLSGNIYLQGEGVYVFSADGSYAFTLTEATYIERMTATDAGDVMYITRDAAAAGNAYLFKTIDFAAGAAGDTVKYIGAHYFNECYRGNNGYMFYYQYQNGIFGMKRDTAESEKVVDFVNSDISFSGDQMFFPTDDGGFIMLSNQYNGRTGERTSAVSRLTEDKNATLEGKTVLTLGVLYGSADDVTRFNKASKTARIIVKDYAEYNTADDRTRGQTQLDLDIISSRGPDIISIQQGSSTKYASKGALADLTPFLDSGKHGVLRENLFENILTAGSSDGKIYNITPRFTIMTLAGKASIFGDGAGITTAKLAEIADKHPDAAIMQDMTSGTWLTYAVWLGMDAYVDWAAGTCAFNSQDFIDALNFSKRFPMEIDYNAMNEASAYMERERDKETMFPEERTLLMNYTVYGPRTAHDMDFIFGEKSALVGYPTTGDNGNVISAGSGYAITAASQNKDIAWEFICDIINHADDADNEAHSIFSGMSINKNVFEAKARAELIPLEDRDFENGVQTIRPYPDGGSSGQILYSADDIDKTDPFFDDYALTQDDVDRATRAITGARTLFSTDEQILDIIMEEAQAFWSGAKSAEETANIIQSRASLYVSESS
ncbi:MAG: extracellular solute-binding protein [Oscillospiraceae bacterium]|jgi:ABC-type glycerol-3-phosphate transport system substrate-binding protein|nr:extracellular solute-binding protein [Oscillospiraceae bacterium]